MGGIGFLRDRGVATAGDPCGKNLAPPEPKSSKFTTPMLLLPPLNKNSGKTFAFARKKILHVCRLKNIPRSDFDKETQQASKDVIIMHALFIPAKTIHTQYRRGSDQNIYCITLFLIAIKLLNVVVQFSFSYRK